MISFVDEREMSRFPESLQFFGLSENPFQLPPSSALPFVTEKIQSVLDELANGIQSRKGLLVLTGEVGTGKTTLAKRLMVWLHEQKIPTAFVFNPHLDPNELFEWMLAGFGASSRKNQQGNARQRLREWLREQHCSGSQAVLIVDEAQGLPLAMFEEVRLLLNEEIGGERVLQILLCGQPELSGILKRPEMRQVRQRIEVWCHTAALDRDEASAYLQKRLHIAGMNGENLFLPETADAIHFYARGIPRVMNLLSEHALLRAAAKELRPIPHAIVDEVARDLQFDEHRPVAGPRNLGDTSIRMPIRHRDADNKDAILPAVHKSPAPCLQMPAATPAITELWTTRDEAERSPIAEARPLTPQRSWIRDTPTPKERLSALGRDVRAAGATASRFLAAVWSFFPAALGALVSACRDGSAGVTDWTHKRLRDANGFLRSLRNRPAAAARLGRHHTADAP